MGDNVTYSLSDDAGGLFSIDATSGDVTTADSLDFETATSHTITAVATSTDGSSSQSDFTINVSNVAEGFASLGLDELDGVNGFTIPGLATGDLAWVVSTAGDVNGDGFDDVIIGAPAANVDGVENTGQSYLIFGTPDDWLPTFDLTTLDGSNGVQLDGVDAIDNSGLSVGDAGDVNGATAKIALMFWGHRKK